MSSMKFYGQFDVPVDRFIYERYFTGVRRGTFIECGAFDGLTECSCKFFEESMEWSGLNLEPVPHIFQKLTNNRPGSRNLNVGLSGSNGKLGFDVVVHPEYGRDTTVGSIAHSPEIRQHLIDSGCSFEHIEIEVISWPELVLREKLNLVDLLVLDVEGHEMNVLAGMHGSTVLPSLMCVEFGHTGFDALRAEMDRLGYVFDTASFANAFFIRKDAVPLFAFRGAVR